MRVFLFLIAPLVLSACASQHDMWGQPVSDIAYGSVIDADEAALSVRRVEVINDFVVIRPDYQIVIGTVPRSIRLDRKVRWEASEKDTRKVPSEPKKTSSVAAVAEGPKISLNETHFNFGSAVLSKSALSLLDTVSVEIESIAPKTLSIIGHTDNIGSEEFNQRLSERRANAVFNYLKSKGLKVEHVERIGFGERYPVADNSNEEGRSKNRRTEIIATVSR